MHKFPRIPAGNFMKANSRIPGGLAVRVYEYSITELLVSCITNEGGELRRSRFKYSMS